MPYVEQRHRRGLQPRSKRAPATTGELTYQMAVLVDRFLAQQDVVSYGTLSQAIAALECCKLEVWRRLGGPLEDVKCQENGDVLTCATDYIA